MAISTLKVLRELSGQTGVQFAEACGMDPARLSRVERGEPPFTPEVARIEVHVRRLVPRLLWGADEATTDRKDPDHAEQS
jgi:transcriptional regulator with XRE-family HTH domain